MLIPMDKSQYPSPLLNSNANTKRLKMGLSWLMYFVLNA